MIKRINIFVSLLIFISLSSCVPFFGSTGTPMVFERIMYVPKKIAGEIPSLFQDSVPTNKNFLPATSKSVKRVDEYTALMKRFIVEDISEPLVEVAKCALMLDTAMANISFSASEYKEFSITIDDNFVNSWKSMIPDFYSYYLQYRSRDSEYVAHAKKIDTIMGYENAYEVQTNNYYPIQLYWSGNKFLGIIDLTLGGLPKSTIIAYNPEERTTSYYFNKDWEYSSISPWGPKYEYMNIDVTDTGVPGEIYFQLALSSKLPRRDDITKVRKEILELYGYIDSTGMVSKRYGISDYLGIGNGNSQFNFWRQVVDGDCAVIYEDLWDVTRQKYWAWDPYPDLPNPGTMEARLIEKLEEVHVPPASMNIHQLKISENGIGTIQVVDSQIQKGMKYIIFNASATDEELKYLDFAYGFGGDEELVPITNGCQNSTITSENILAAWSNIQSRFIGILDGVEEGYGSLRISNLAQVEGMRNMLYAYPVKVDTSLPTWSQDRQYDFTSEGECIFNIPNIP